MSCVGSLSSRFPVCVFVCVNSLPHRLCLNHTSLWGVAFNIAALWWERVFQRVVSPRLKLKPKFSGRNRGSRKRYWEYTQSVRAQLRVASSYPADYYETRALWQTDAGRLLHVRLTVCCLCTRDNRGASDFSSDRFTSSQALRAEVPQLQP